MTDAVITWEGAEALRPLLVPIDDVETHPRNPWRGNVDEIAKSLKRFGQLFPILTDGQQIVAGNHTYLAARALGWSHVAATANEFADPEEARRYMLADNRTAQLADYDRAQLKALVEELDASGQWEGTGYVPDDLADMREMERLDAGAAALAGFDPGQSAPIEMRDITLLFTGDQYDRFGSCLRILRPKYETEGVVATVLRAVEADARHLNLGAPVDAPDAGEGQ